MTFPERTPAYEARRRHHVDAAIYERYIAQLEWLLSSKLGSFHRARIEKELREHREALACLLAEQRTRSC